MKLHKLIKKIRMEINLYPEIESSKEYRQMVKWESQLHKFIKKVHDNKDLWSLYSIISSKLERYEVKNKLVSKSEHYICEEDRQRKTLEMMFMNKNELYNSKTKEDFQKITGVTEERLEEIWNGAELLCSEARNIARKTTIIPSYIFGFSKEEAYSCLHTNYDFDPESNPELAKYYRSKEN